MGDEADDIITSFGLSEQEMKSYETVQNRFENHFIAKRNVIFEKVKSSSSVEDSITDLHCLAKYCEFGVLKDQLIRDRIVVGLKNKKLSEKLQLDPELTLQKAIAQARQNEEIKKTSKYYTICPSLSEKRMSLRSFYSFTSTNRNFNDTLCASQ